MSLQKRRIDVSAFATTDYTNGYRHCFPLEAGYTYRLKTFRVLAATNYIAADTNYETFYLYDSSGNVIASVANGTATTGLTIGPVTTGVDITMDSTYEVINCASAAGYVYVMNGNTGVGRAMVGVAFEIEFYKERAPV